MNAIIATIVLNVDVIIFKTFCNIEVQNTYPGFVRRIREVGLLIQVELKHVKKQVVHAITHKIDNRIRGGKQCDKDL